MKTGTSSGRFQILQIVPVQKSRLLEDFSNLVELCVQVMVVPLNALELLKGSGTPNLLQVCNNWHDGHLVIGIVNVSNSALPSLRDFDIAFHVALQNP